MKGSGWLCAAAAPIGLLLATAAIAQDSCTSMQVYLGIAQNRRENVMSYIAPRLKQKFGSDLVAEEMGSNTMVERIAAQGTAPRVSIAFWDFPVAVDACNRGFCKPVDMARAPNIGNLYDWATIRNDAGQPIVTASNVIAIGLIYNEEEFEKRKLPLPTAWSDLNRADLKGRVSITSPVSTYGTASLLMLARLNGGSEANIDPGFAATKALMPNVHAVHTFSAELSNLLQLREVWMATTGSNVVPEMRAKGMPVRFVSPKEGAPALLAGGSLIANSQCDGAAHEFLNLYYSDEFQAMRIREGDSSPSRTVWKDVPAADRSRLSLQPEQYDNLVQIDWKVASPRRPEWLRRWQREIR